MKLCIVEDTTWNDNYLHFVHLKSASWRCYKFWDFRIQHVKHCDRCVQDIMLCPVHDRRKTQFWFLFNLCCCWVYTSKSSCDKDKCLYFCRKIIQLHLILPSAYSPLYWSLLKLSWKRKRSGAHKIYLGFLRWKSKYQNTFTEL